MLRKSIIYLLLLAVFSSCHKKFGPRKLTAENYIYTNNSIARKQMKRHGIPASILLAQGMLESKNGSTETALLGNNHFNVKCPKNWYGRTFNSAQDGDSECYKKYKSVSASYEDHCHYIRSQKRFRNLYHLDRGDYKGWANGLRDSAYSTNSRYNTQLINLIEKHKLYEYD